MDTTLTNLHSEFNVHFFLIDILRFIVGTPNKSLHNYSEKLFTKNPSIHAKMHTTGCAQNLLRIYCSIAEAKMSNENTHPNCSGFISAKHIWKWSERFGVPKVVSPSINSNYRQEEFSVFRKAAELKGHQYGCHMAKLHQRKPSHITSMKHWRY